MSVVGKIKNNILIIIALSLTVFVAGCAGGSKSSTSDTDALLAERGIIAPIDAAEHGPEIGNKKGFLAPDFTVTTTDGKVLNLRELSAAGKPTMVYFMATWCPFCIRDLAAVNKAYPPYKDDIEFIAISLDLSESSALLAQYKQQRNHPLLNFAPGTSKILSDYAVRSTTTKFAIDRNGVILFAGSGAVDENTWRVIFEGLKA